MSKCRKAKNACKICMRQVTRKTGLQCEGACESWVHYECLNYTPGKIQDIKKKVIRVTCPCPDCKSTLPKEHRINGPYTCTNPSCPANLPPRCKNKKCPLGPTSDEKSGCSLGQCGNTSCKDNSTKMGGFKDIIRKASQGVGVGVGGGCGPPCHTGPTQDACTDYSSCRSSRSSMGDVAGDFCQTTTSGIEEMCAAVGQLTCQITDLMYKMKEALEHSKGGRNKPQFQACHCPGNPCRK